jgi:hypothetical protein
VCNLQKYAVVGQVLMGTYSYELRDAPGRRLRRWPRRATLGQAADPAEHILSVLQPQRWLWDE